MICYFCQDNISSNEELIKHTVINHSDEKIYRCCEQSCTRTFSILKSFTRHRKTVHNSTFNIKKKKPIQICDNRPSTSREINKDEQNEFQCDLSQNHMQNLHFSVQANDKLYDNNDEININENSKSISQENIDMNMLTFTSSLYNILELPRNKIDLIVNNVINLLTGTLNSVQVNIQQTLKKKYDIQDEIFISEIIEN